jgi:hypothetical protein
VLLGCAVRVSHVFGNPGVQSFFVHVHDVMKPASDSVGSSAVLQYVDAL